MKTSTTGIFSGSTKSFLFDVWIKLIACLLLFRPLCFTKPILLVSCSRSCVCASVVFLCLDPRSCIAFVVSSRSFSWTRILRFSHTSPCVILASVYRHVGFLASLRNPVLYLPFHLCRPRLAERAIHVENFSVGISRTQSRHFRTFQPFHDRILGILHSEYRSAVKCSCDPAQASLSIFFSVPYEESLLRLA
ncbi:hypothetical protein EDD85DRAFT_395356 [Armillaria nabsnona]|nr:hypothetical protein EDD85DRAFT_395356 [Armillaria nabsnona]